MELNSTFFYGCLLKWLLPCAHSKINDFCTSRNENAHAEYVKLVCLCIFRLMGNWVICAETLPSLNFSGAWL